MSLKPSQIRFKFPIRIYDPKYKDSADSEDKEDSMYILTRSHQEDPGFVIGIAAVFIDEIGPYVETLTRFEDLKAFQGKKLPCTHVILKGGDEFISSWNVERFEQEYDKHVERLEDDMEEHVQTISIDDENLPQFEAAIKDYKKKRKLQEKL